jgi:hypothetical protein
MNNLYRVLVKTTHSLQPSGTTWSNEVLYCGESSTEARVVYHKSRPLDYWRGYGNQARDTKMQVLDEDDIEDGDPGEFITYDEDD